MLCCRISGFQNHRHSRKRCNRRQSTFFGKPVLNNTKLKTSQDKSNRYKYTMSESQVINEHTANV